MHRLNRKDLQLIIAVAMTTAPRSIKWKLNSRDSFDVERGERELVDYICDKIDNDSLMVIAADPVGFGASSRRGKWGVDEPVPATLPLFPKP
jgi:hypothetical protein